MSHLLYWQNSKLAEMSDVYGGKSTLTLAEWKFYTFFIFLTMAHNIPCYAMKPYEDQTFTTKENFIIAVKHVSVHYDYILCAASC